MFRFEDPTYLYFLAVIPVIALLRIIFESNRKQKLRKMGEPDLLRQLMPEVSKWRPGIKFWLLETALALMIIMIARPQLGTKISNEKRVGIETIIAMDISNSMRANDVEPSRIDRSKMMIENMVDHFTNDKIGLIVFAGDAFVQLPITSDYVSAKMFLNNIDPSMIASQGTDIATAINMATHSFTQEENIGKAIIVITDGEDHEGGAVEAAKEAKKKGFRVFVLGVGSPEGSPIPVPETNDYMRDNTGNTVMSALNEEMCRQVAEAGGGAYIHVSNNSNAQSQLENELSKLSKKETSSTIYSDYDDQFQAFAIIILILLCIEICVLECKNPLLQRFRLFGNRKTATLLLCMTASAIYAQNDRQYIREGNREFRAGNYANAEVAYRKAIEKNPANPQAAYNLGNALFAQKKDSAAVQSFESAAKLEKNPLRRALAYHNIGVACQGHKMYAEAIEAYKSALRLNPKDDTTRYNLELCKKQQKKQDKDKDKQKQKNQEDKQKKDKEKEQKQDKDKQKEQKQQDKDKMSKDNAEQLLNAAMQSEKNTQQRLNKAMRKPSSKKLQKNW
ncbi:vWA domain-containing protein [Xylanibacter muris]|uniref:VWA domain-containing protein n=1 Tax=Xylanibacter muris TaxID=2736290 RepID=A0ABX2AQZ4_9BACT|nr:VWA domain-containing protein [Xylanibacter muris]NPD92667.1 VWA domain-containing protein [Xylanibacter muris]